MRCWLRRHDTGDGRVEVRARVAVGRDGSAAGLLGEMQTRQELYGLIGYEPGRAWEWPVA